MKRLLFTALGALLFAPGSFALVDSNNNGISDFWERDQNAGDLFSETFDTQADPDADGWTNAQEAAAGTNPFDPNPPDGLIRPDFTHIPPVMGEDEWGPYIITPEAVTVAWPTLVGKQYALLFSPDLTEGSWIPVGSPFIGNGNDVEYGFQISGSDKRFWRVAVTDADTDGDTLTDSEEYSIGSSSYLADTDGDGINDGEAFAEGMNPSGDGGDSDGDGIPDNELYSVVFEVQHESHSMPYGVGWASYDESDEVHRYLTYKYTERYSVSGSGRYSEVTDAEHVWTYTHLVNGTIPENGQPEPTEQGASLSDWKSNHGTNLGEGETLHEDETVTAYDVPTITATQIKSTTTETTPWTVRKDGNVVRSGSEVITVTEQYDLSDEVTFQQLWNNHVKPRTWIDSPPSKYGPLNWVDYNRVYFGDAMAAEHIRDYFHNHDFGIFGDISNPGSAYPDYGADNRIKSLRWRWIKFNPQSPFGYEYATPPAAVRKTFHLLVTQRDFLDSRESSGANPLVDESEPQGIVEIECKANEGTIDWQSVPLNKFDPYKVVDPVHLANMDFPEWGYSQVFFGNLPVKIAPDSNMVGVIGDVINSTIVNSDTKHFVTPQQTAELNQAHVELHAQGVTPEQFAQYFEWEGGDAGNGANKRKAQRNTHGVTDVKIKSKFSGSIVAKMRVWAVWSNVSVTPYENVRFMRHLTEGVYDGTAGFDHAWRFVFKLLPEELFSSTIDRPNLIGESTTDVPGKNKPYFAEPSTGGDSARSKWDASRQVENRIYNRQLIPKPQFPNLQMFANQPVAEETVAAYPQIASEGNDDPNLPEPDENANPYAAFVGQGLNHEIGQISSCDGPRFATPMAPVSAGASFVNVANFREFARLEIASETPAAGGTTWYRISEYKTWHHVLSTIYGRPPGNNDYFWGDAGSASGEGVFSIPEEE